MAYLKIFITSILLTAIVNCAPIKVSSEQDNKIDFSKLNTYAWGQNSLSADRIAGSVNEIIQNVEDMARRDIQHLTDDELASKGYHISDNDKPDFLVQYTARGHSAGSLERGNFAPNESVYLVNNTGTFIIGYLTIDIVDPQTKQILWRGNAEAVITGDGTSNKRLNKIIKKILKTIPQK